MLFWIDERGSVIPNSEGTRRGRVAHARSQIDSLRAAHDGRAVVLSSVGAVAWATGGLSIPIDRVAALDPLWVVVRDEGATLVVSSVEVPRLVDEVDLGALGFDVVSAPWYVGDAHRATVERLTGVAFSECLSDGPEGIDVTTELTALRCSLGPDELEVMSALANVATRALEGAVRSWRPGHSRDRDVASDIAGALERHGADAVCLIVGGDERVRHFRHPIMSGDVVERLVMAVVVARSQGLHVALTRLACVGGDDQLEQALLKCDIVNQRVLGATRIGHTWGEAYEALADGYRAVEAPEAWREHFQGGPIGYGQREFELSPEGSSSPWWSLPVAATTAVAWNPSLAGGAKVEDTYVVGPDGVRCLTDSGEWPRFEGAHPGAAVLVR
jgi:Xaa-Pro dipeptidase